MSTPTSSSSHMSLDPEIVSALHGLPKDFDGFGKIIQDEIRPSLHAKEEERLTAAKRARMFTGIAIAAGIIGALLSFAVFRTPQLVILALVVAGGLYAFGRWPLEQIKKQAKGLIIVPLAHEMGLDYAEAPGPQPLASTMRQMNLLPSWDKSKFEDKLVGERNGRPFEFFEATLKEKRTTRSSNGSTSTKWVTVFQGQCLKVKVGKTFYGQTVVIRDLGFLNALGFGSGGLKRARLEDPEFEKSFEVYTSDQVEARYLMTPDVMHRIMGVEKAFHGSKLRFAFADQSLYLAVEGGNMFEPGSMFTPLDNPERIRELLDDMAAIFNLIDEMAVGDADE